jgi:hypothetical protein
MTNAATPTEAILKPELWIVDPSAAYRDDFPGHFAADAAGLESCVDEFLRASDLAEF